MSETGQEVTKERSKDIDDVEFAIIPRVFIERHCSKGYLFSAMKKDIIKHCSALNARFLKRRIAHAKGFVLAYDRYRNVIGFIAIKQPREEHLIDIFSKVGMTPDRWIQNVKYELGWKWVSEEWRGLGIGNMLIKVALSTLDNSEIVISTTLASNECVVKCLERNGFTSMGSYKSTIIDDEYVRVFIRL